MSNITNRVYAHARQYWHQTRAANYTSDQRKMGVVVQFVLVCAGDRQSKPVRRLVQEYTLGIYILGIRCVLDLMVTGVVSQGKNHDFTRDPASSQNIAVFKTSDTIRPLSAWDGFRRPEEHLFWSALQLPQWPRPQCMRQPRRRLAASATQTPWRQAPRPSARS